jgi:hypothetical protein
MGGDIEFLPSLIKEPASNGAGLRRSREQRLREAQELLSNQKLVHDWLCFQCRYDPELRHTYELYIGPVPGLPDK